MIKFSADIRNRIGFNKFYKEDAEKAIKKYSDETASLLEDILKELGLDGDVVDKQGVIGRLKIRKHGPIVFIWFKPNSNNEDPYSWNVDDIINEINRLTQDFHKA